MASRSATGKVQVTATADLKNLLNNASKQATSQVGASAFISTSFTRSGVQSGQFNRAWEETEIEIAENANIEINLASFAGRDIGAGSGNDAVGLAMDLEEVVLIIIKNTTTADAGAAGGPFLEVEPAAASGWGPIGTHTVANGGAIPPGGCLMKYAPGEAGFDVQGGTSERIKLTAKTGDVTVAVLVFGRNDDDDSSSSSSTSSQSSSASSVSSSSLSSSISSSLSSSSSS